VEWSSLVLTAPPARSHLLYSATHPRPAALVDAQLTPVPCPVACAGAIHLLFVSGAVHLHRPREWRVIADLNARSEPALTSNVLSTLTPSDASAQHSGDGASERPHPRPTRALTDCPLLPVLVLVVSGDSFVELERASDWLRHQRGWSLFCYQGKGSEPDIPFVSLAQVSSAGGGTGSCHCHPLSSIAELVL
jgi:hypothetical protein